jgi:hypothetical protein
VAAPAPTVVAATGALDAASVAAVPIVVVVTGSAILILLGL